MMSVGPSKQPADAALLELILESAAEGIVFVQSEKTIGYINQAGREILRCARGNDSPPFLTDLTTLLGFETLSIAPNDSVAGKLKGLPLTWQPKWSMASYPGGVSTAAEMVATAIQAVLGAKAEVIALLQP
jgi:hypothetical protein